MSTAVHFDFDGKIALVTGASRGIGKAIAHALAARGATVVLSSRKQAGLDTAAAEINDAGVPGRALPVACHIGQPASLAALFAYVETELGRLDVLVNNAATNPYFGPAIDAPERAYDKTMEVNLKGYFLASQHAARMMVAQGEGVIVNVASITGISPEVNQVVYSMTKAAVISMTRGMAKELGPAGVRVNAIAPGLVETRLAAGLIDDPTMHQTFLEATPLRRHGQPVEIAGAAVYLASSAARFTTGAVLVCDGGVTA